MAELQTNRADGSRRDPEIVVREPHVYPWPASLDSTRYGAPLAKSQWPFRCLLRLLEVTKPEYKWIYFFLNSNEEINSIAAFEDVIFELNRLFEDELGSPFSIEQRNLLIKSQIVAVAVDRKSGSIAGYSASSYVPGGNLRGIDRPLSLGNHCVIASQHQRFKVGMYMGAISMMHGQKVGDLFKTNYCVLRTNNRYVYKPLSQTGPTYRSDKLGHHNLTEIEKIAQQAIRYMHDDVFELKDVPLPFDRPLEIQHSFDPAVTIEGVGSNQIVYIFGTTSPAKGIFKLLARRVKRTVPNA